MNPLTLHTFFYTCLLSLLAWPALGQGPVLVGDISQLTGPPPLGSVIRTSAMEYCILGYEAFTDNEFIPTPANLLTGPKSATFDVNYLPDGARLLGHTCATWPAEAQLAMNYATAIWSSFITSPVPIQVDACWSGDLDVLTLSTAGSANYVYYQPTPALPETFFPKGLAEALEGEAILLGGDTELNAIFNANFSDYYFGTDGMPGSGKIDFVTIALHELGHALGFSGSALLEGEAGHLGFDIGGAAPVPTIFTRFVETEKGASVSESVTNPGTDMASLLTGQPNATFGEGLFFNGPKTKAKNNGQSARLYLPEEFTPGVSYTHLDRLFDDELIKPVLRYGQAIHDPGICGAVLLDLGWDGSFELPGSALPVELIRFAGKAFSADAIQLSWATATELDNLGFAIERSEDAREWHEVAFVAGHNTTDRQIEYTYLDRDLLPLTYFYRLRQIDHDGTESLSTPVSVQLRSDRSVVKLYPVPATRELIIDGNLPPDGTLEVFTTTGSLAVRVRPAAFPYRLNTMHWVPGVYLLRYRTGNQVDQWTFTKS